MQKSALIAPITGLSAVASDHASMIVYAGRGNELLTFLQGNIQVAHTLRVFDHHNVHGINTCRDSRGSELVLVHGDKAVALCSTSTIGAVTKTHVCCRLRRLDDMVLVTCWATLSGKELLYVGYVHNFLDVFAVDAAVVSGQAAPQLVQRVRAQDTCCLFSMSIVPEMTRVVVTGGTAFGPIYLWATCPAGASTEEAATSDPSTHLSIAGHEGVVFRTSWNEDRTLLASVSDDRSVRLWDMRESQGEPSAAAGCSKGKQLFVGWGHISRVWDVVFLHGCSSTKYVVLATCSEDGTVKLWRAQRHLVVQEGEKALDVTASTEADVNTKSVGGCCIHTFRGHRGDVWRIIPVLGSKSQSLLLSGGNDSAVKVWDASPWTSQLPVGQEPQVDRGRRRAQIPQWPSNSDGCIAAEKKNQGSARSGGVAGMSFSPCATWLIVSLIDGGLWLVTGLRGKLDTDIEWTPIWSSGAKISSLSVLYNEKHAVSQAVVSLAHPRGLATIVVVELKPRSISFEKQWQAHTMNTVSCWLLYSNHYSLNAQYILAAHLVTSSVKGSFKVWKVLISTPDNSVKDKYCETSVEILLDAVTGKAQEIVTSVAVLAADTDGSAAVVTGDIRGSISVHATSLEAWNRTKPSSPAQFLHRVHAGEPVSCITVLPGDDAFASGGNDGKIAFYQRQHGHPSFCFKCINVFSALPIRAPQSLRAPPEGLMSNPNDHEELFIGGYYGDTFMVYDMKRSNQLLHVDGGSWKRQSTFALFNQADSGGADHSSVTMPGVIFASAVPITGLNKGKGTDLEWYCNQPLAWNLTGESMRDAGTSHLGRVSYAGAYIGTHLATGGEEGRLQLLGAACPTSGRRSLLQEAALPQFFSIKALASAEVRDGSSGVLVGGGSRLSYSVWAWSDSKVPLSIVASGSVWPNAPQDHRILCAAAGRMTCNQSDSENNRFCVALCDSRGIAALSIVSSSEVESPAKRGEGVSPHSKTIPTLCFEEEFEACGGATILDCKLLEAKATSGRASATFGVFGATNGQVAIWWLGGRFSKAGGPSRILAKFQAHSMGANAVDAFLSPSEGADSFTLVVSSGGDDQAITLGCGVLVGSTTGLTWSKPFRTQQFNSATSASVQGISWTGARTCDGGWGLVSLSADQRLHHWTATVIPETFENIPYGCDAIAVGDTRSAYAACGGSNLRGMDLRWVEGIVSNIGDPQGLVFGAGKLAVVGQGTQEVIMS